MSEANAWAGLRKHLVLNSEDFVLRVENSAYPGTPDVWWVMGGQSGWIELKWLPSWPKRPSTVVRVDHFTPQQRVCLSLLRRARAQAHVVAKIEDDWLLFSGEAAAEFLGRLPREKLLEKTIKVWNGRLDTQELRRCLKTPLDR